MNVAEHGSIDTSADSTDSEQRRRNRLRDSFWHDLQKADERNDPYTMEGIVAEVRLNCCYELIFKIWLILKLFD